LETISAHSNDHLNDKAVSEISHTSNVSANFFKYDADEEEVKGSLSVPPDRSKNYIEYSDANASKELFKDELTGL
jgi:hypothetical protein